jgi:hypothetical protein
MIETDSSTGKMAPLYASEQSRTDAGLIVRKAAATRLAVNTFFLSSGMS